MCKRLGSGVVDECKRWYAAKVKPHTEKKIKDYLSLHQIEHYIPFRTVMVEHNGVRKKKEKPVIPGLIFIFEVKEGLFKLPLESGLSMAFMHRLGSNDLLVVPDKQMSDFMFVLDLSEDTISIPNENLRRGARVRIIKGDLAGIEGELIRIKGHKRVVVRLEGLFSLATTYIPRGYLEVIKN